MTPGRISVVTPVFNGEKFLTACIESVLDALPPNSEYIIVNDGSTDGTQRILDSYARFVRVIIQSNVGEALAVNRGVLESTGDYICVVNADDLISENLPTESVQFLDAHPDIVLTYCDWGRIDSSGRLVEEITVPEYSIEALFAEFRCLPGPGAVFRAASLAGEQLRDPRYKYVSDYEAWLRLAMKGPFHKLSMLGAYWREHDQSASISGNLREMARERTVLIPTLVYEKGRQLPREMSLLVPEAEGNALYSAALLGVRDPAINSRRLVVQAWNVLGRIPTTATHFTFACLLVHPLPAYGHKFLEWIGVRVSRGGSLGFRIQGLRSVRNEYPSRRRTADS